MAKLKALRIAIILSVTMPIWVADMAFAAKKPVHPTYEQAWARCNVHVDKLGTDQQSARYSRGAACMHMFGYRI
jgi:hypothetical protein